MSDPCHATSEIGGIGKRGVRHGDMGLGWIGGKILGPKEMLGQPMLVFVRRTFASIFAMKR
jgi:hypothetical protein